MTFEELVFAVILLVTAAALAGFWLTMRSPQPQEPPETPQPPPPSTPVTQPQRRPAQQRPTRQEQPSKTQRQQAQAAPAQKASTSGPVQNKEEGGGSEEAPIQSGEAGVGAEGAGGSDLEAQRVLEETLNLYADLLQEMERLKKKLEGKLP